MLLPFLNGFSESDNVFTESGSTAEEINDLLAASPDDGSLYLKRAKVRGKQEIFLPLSR